MWRTIAAFLFALSLMAGDVSGTWLATVETDAGSGSPTFVLKQDGDKLTGTYSGQLGEAPVTGTVKGDQVKITFKINAQGEDLAVEYVGKLDGEKKMAGTTTLGSLAKGTFTAVRK